MLDVVDCTEFGELSLRVRDLLREGELRLDERIATKGYLNATIQRGQIVLRATRYVGLIPLTDEVAIRVQPRATISNLSLMLVRSGVIPTAVSGFSRGYLPRLTTFDEPESVYGDSLITAIAEVSKRGFFKEYVRPLHPSTWRGRIAITDTVKRFASKGIRYRHVFDEVTLTASTIENIGLKSALRQVATWQAARGHQNSTVALARSLLADMQPIADWNESRSRLLEQLVMRLHRLPSHLKHYREPLWTAVLILQSALPETQKDGLIDLDSLIIDISKVFEAFVRIEVEAALLQRGYTVVDGNLNPPPLFVDSKKYIVKPDIIIKRADDIVAVIDVKYKPAATEQDRYQLLAFMDALGIKQGGFVLPVSDGIRSIFLGTTISGQRVYSWRFDMAAEDPIAEAQALGLKIVADLRL